MLGHCNYIAHVGRRRSTVGIKPSIKVARVVNNAAPEFQIPGTAAEDPAL
jgi:hypothetical protein